MKASHFGIILMALSSLATFAVNAADIEAGKAKSAVCAACHGVDGNSSNGAWPSLAGQHASYLSKQLREFKSGARANPVMLGMAAILSDADVENVAVFYESQKLNPVPFDGALIEKGENIYRGGITETAVAACMSCHAPSGRGNGPAGWPSLRGQHPQYLVGQLRQFRDGTRANDNVSMMRSVAARMSDREMESVAAYIAGIH